MKKGIMLTALIIVGLIFYAGPAAGAGVVGSKHDFSFTTGGITFVGSSDQVCVYCHTPHGGISADSSGNAVPLWNRTLNEGNSFTMYNSPTFDGTVGSKPTGNSLLCLSCHDGITSLGGAIINPGGAAIIFNYNNISAAVSGPNDPINKIIIGQDLTNDHPVSFTYDDALVTTDAHGGAAALKSPGVNGANLSPLKLYNQRLECGTCHDPHEYGAPGSGKQPFLRMTNAGSEMCLTCHIK